MCFQARAEVGAFSARRKSTAVLVASHSQTGIPIFVSKVSLSLASALRARRRLMFQINLFLFSTFPCAALFFSPFVIALARLLTIKSICGTSFSAGPLPWVPRV